MGKKLYYLFKKKKIMQDDMRESNDAKICYLHNYSFNIVCINHV